MVTAFDFETAMAEGREEATGDAMVRAAIDFVAIAVIEFAQVDGSCRGIPA